MPLKKTNNNDTCHSKLFDLFNNKFKIYFLCRQNLHFTVSYSDPEDTYSRFFDGINGAKSLWVNFFKFLDISLVPFID